MALARAAAESALRSLSGSLDLPPRAHEIGVETVEKKSLGDLDARNLRPLGHWRNLEQLRMLGAYAPPGSAPFDLVMESSGARSHTAAAAEPLLGVDCLNPKKRFRALIFSLSR